MSDQDIGDWLEALGLDAYADAFRAHDIDLDVLPELDVAELRELGLSLGHAKRILRAIRERDDAVPEVGTGEGRTAADGGAERRQLTVAFCDLVGSTGLSESLDPEDLRTLLDGYYRLCAEVARRFGGDLAKVTGDGVDLYFGYPHAFERSATAAVESALEVVESVAALNDARSPGVPELSVRVGVHTGLVVVGAVGGSGSDAGTAVGDVPVVAARIQSAARPGTVIISEATAHLVEGAFHLEDTGLHELKGLSAPIRLFAVTAPDVGRDGGPGTPSDDVIVGREAEMASLLTRWELARGGRGQVVVLTGEAGIGKSRVTQALASTASGPLTVVRYQCSPYRTGTALWPVIEQLRRAGEIQRGDPEPVRLERLERLLGADWNGSAPPDTVPVLATLLSIDYEQRYPGIALAADQLRERTLQRITEHLQASSRRRPVVVVFEDVHWADPTSLELIAGLVECCSEWPMLVVVTCRPEHSVPWADQPHVATVRLGGLADRHVRAIVQQVTQGKSLPANVLDRILARTDGVPMFVEELTRTLLESGLLVDEGATYALAGPLVDTAIPATLHDSLAARLDRLGPLKTVAQVASVIGREFSLDLLAETTRLIRSELAASLEMLEQSGLVLRRDGRSTEWYTFKHALVQNAAYESMLRSTRRDLHARIATALEQRPEVRGEQPELLARHLDQAGLVERAIDAYVHAGEHATTRSNHEEAVGHYRRALQLLSVLPPSRERSERALAVHTPLRNALVVLRGYSSPEVEEECVVASELCEELGATEELFPVLWNLAGFHMVRGDHAVCEGINARLLGIAESAADADLALMAHDTVGQTLYYQARFEEAVAHLSRARELYDPEAHREIAARYAEEDPGVAALGYGGVALWALGRRSEGRAWLDQAVALAESLSFHASRGIVMSLVVHLAYCRNDLGPARTAAAALRELSDEHGLGFYMPSAQVQQGWVLAMDGDVDEGLELMRAGIAGLKRAGALVENPFNTLLLADGLLLAALPADAVAVLDETLAQVERTGERCLETELLRVRGEARAAHGAVRADVEHDLRAALALATERGARSFRLHAAAALARYQLGSDLPVDASALDSALAAIDDDLDEPDVHEAALLLARCAPVGGPGSTQLNG